MNQTIRNPYICIGQPEGTKILNNIGKIVNKQRIVCDRIPGSKYSYIIYRGE